MQRRRKKERAAEDELLRGPVPCCLLVPLSRRRGPTWNHAAGADPGGRGTLVPWPRRRRRAPSQGWGPAGAAEAGPCVWNSFANLAVEGTAPRTASTGRG